MVISPSLFYTVFESVLAAVRGDRGESVPKLSWDVVVVGAGVLGSFHAYFAGRLGLRTLLLERSDFPRQASVRNFGMVIPSGMADDDWHRRGQESASLYRRLSHELNYSIKTGGTQYLATTPIEEQILREFSQLGPMFGSACQFLDARQSLRLNSILHPETCRASLLFPGDLRFDPRDFVRQLILRMTRGKLSDYRPNTVAVKVERHGSACRITTADGTEEMARHVFVCAGADLRTLFPQTFANSGLSRCKLQMMRIVPLDGVSLFGSLASGLSLRHYPSFRRCPSWPRLAEESVHPELARRGIHVLLVQDADGRFVVGDSHEYSSGDFDDTLDPTTEDWILTEARRLVRLPDWTIAERWHGIYTLHPDRPIFEHTVDDRIHIVTGIGGKGMTTSPAVARESIQNHVIRS
jgi:FAD dependent oxidoreductase TIGR03364